LGSNPSISSSSLEATAPSNSSSSSDGSPGGCLLKIEGVDFECIEEDNIYGSKQVCAGFHGEWVSSCPSGGVKCELESSGIKFVATFYAEEDNPCYSSLANIVSSSSSVLSSSSVVPSSSSIVPSNSSSSSNSNPSSDSNSEHGVCYFNVFNLYSLCMESITEPITRSECEEVSDEGFTASFLNSCPSGHKLMCEEYDDEYDVTYSVYYYGDMFGSLTCSDLEY
jgi:hypothetical protein